MSNEEYPDLELEADNNFVTMSPEGLSTMVINSSNKTLTIKPKDSQGLIVEQDGKRYLLPAGESFTWPPYGFRNKLRALKMRLRARITR